MNSAELFAALRLPPSARVDQRVPKKLLVENGAPTAADKRKLNEGIEELSWLAALKPTTIGVPEFRDATREYLEIAILHVALRPTAPTARLTALVHRSVPYPALLIASQGNALELSLVHKRRSQTGAETVVLDGELVVAAIAPLSDSNVRTSFEAAMALSRQPCADLLALYQGWLDTVVALLAAQATGTFTSASSVEMATERRTALAECRELESQIAKLRAAAAKERQLHRQVELNTKIKRLQSNCAAARSRL